MKNLTLIFGCLLLSVIPSQAAEKQQQLSSPTQQFEEIERYITRLRQGVETYYANQIIEVQQRGESEIGQLEEVIDQTIYSNLVAQTEVAEAVLHINGIDNYYYRDYQGYRQDNLNYRNFHASWYLEREIEMMLQLKVGFDKIKPSEWFAVVQSLIAERKSDILAKMAFETANLERQKNYALTVTLPELEKRLKENQLKPEPKPTHGLVTGIVYSADKPAAVVDRKIVYEGDVIYGVKVVKIYQDSVKFSKKSKNWEQKVQQAP
jgi:hypothetical protein